MRTVNYSDVLQGSLALAGIPLAGFDYTQPEFALLRTFHDRRLRLAWEIHAWPEICPYEQRSFRPPWNAATTYAVGAEVLDLVSLNYFQALQASTGQAPTTAGVVNGVYWALCQTQVTADDFDSTKVYAVGDQVRNPADGLFYQLYAVAESVMVNGAGVATLNGNYQKFDSSTYVLNGELVTGTGIFIKHIGDLSDPNPYWLLTLVGTGSAYRSAIGSFVTPDLAGPWISVDTSTPPNPSATNNPPPTVTSSTYAGVPKSGSLFWGLLTPFQRYVAFEQTDINGAALPPIGEVLGAWNRDPRLSTQAVKLPFLITNDGFNFTPARHCPALIWLHYRWQRPSFTGDLFDATLVYTSGRQVYYADATTRIGNFYTATATTAPGESPATTPAKWTVVTIPYTFREYLVSGGYADWLTQDGQADKVTAVEGMAESLLELEADKLQRQQQQVNRFDYRG